MHAVFMVYGLHNLVEEFKWELTTTKLPLKLWQIDENGKRVDKGATTMQCQLRVLPGGFLDFVFPREFKASVLKGLKFYQKDGGHLNFQADMEYSVMGFKIKPFEYLRKGLKLDDVPALTEEEEKEGAYPFMFCQNISIIPVGLRNDSDIEEPNGRLWHEAI